MSAPPKIALLLGAGFSYELGMPLANGLTDVLLEPFNERNVTQLVSAMSRGRPYGASRPPNERAVAQCFKVLLDFKSARNPNYEAMLAQLEVLATQYNVSQSDRDSVHYVLVMLYELIHDVLSLYQAASYELCYPQNLRWYSTLGNLLSTVETWVFSLNHDLFLEFLAIDLKIPISYGDIETKELPISNLEMKERVRFSCIKRSRHNMDSPGFIRHRHSTPDFLEPFDYDSRILRAISGATLWMDYCKSNHWDAAQMEGLKENVALRKTVSERVEAALRAGRRPRRDPLLNPATSSSG